MRLLLIALALSSLPPEIRKAQGPSSVAGQIEVYRSAAIGAKGSLVITRSDRKVIVVPKTGEQTAFAEPRLSVDRTAVGAQAQFPNCCTSYDIPLHLVVYADGRAHRFKGIGLPIFQWHFADGGTRVAYSQETVHSSCATHYELREIRSERLIDSIDIPAAPCGEGLSRGRKVPKWVTALIAARKPS